MKSDPEPVLLAVSLAPSKITLAEGRGTYRTLSVSLAVSVIASLHPEELGRGSWVLNPRGLHRTSFLAGSAGSSCWS